MSPFDLFTGSNAIGSTSSWLIYNSADGKQLWRIPRITRHFSFPNWMVWSIIQIQSSAICFCRWSLKYPMRNNQSRPLYHDGEHWDKPKNDEIISNMRLAPLRLVRPDKMNNRNRWIWSIEYLWNEGIKLNLSGTGVIIFDFFLPRTQQVSF